jgi:hypothetical protein
LYPTSLAAGYRKTKHIPLDTSGGTQCFKPQLSCQRVMLPGFHDLDPEIAKDVLWSHLKKLELGDASFSEVGVLIL